MRSGKLVALIHFRAVAIVMAGLIATALLLWSDGVDAQTFETRAKQAFLMDAETGAVLYAKNADELMVPASMAKIMTVEVIAEEMRRGRITDATEFVISEDAWRRGGAPSRGSTMFAELGSTVKLWDLLRGIIVQSGNDAAIAAAETIAGSEGAFGRMMTQRARELGLTRSFFTNATGFHDPDQLTTARELALLTRHFIETSPEIYTLYAEEEFTWNDIRQRNRNPLLTMGIGADGVKTGFVSESGYGLVGSAVQLDQRLILVVNGLESARDRAIEARRLLEWGFRAFEPRQLFEAGETVGHARVYGGDANYVSLVAHAPVRVLMPRGADERLSARIVYRGPLQVPVKKGDEIGIIQVMRGDALALEAPLFAAEDISQGTLTQRALDAIWELASGAVRRAIFGSESG